MVDKDTGKINSEGLLVRGIEKNGEQKDTYPQNKHKHTNIHTPVYTHMHMHPSLGLTVPYMGRTVSSLH